MIIAAHLRVIGTHILTVVGKGTILLRIHHWQGTSKSVEGQEYPSEILDSFVNCRREDDSG
jgi:hypothetical protein